MTDSRAPQLAQSSVAIDYVNLADCLPAPAAEDIRLGCFARSSTTTRQIISSYKQLADLQVQDQDGLRPSDGLIQLHIRHGNQTVTDVNASYPVGSEFVVDYVVSDWSGNVAESSQSWFVVDTLAPLIALRSDAVLSLTLSDTYTDAGAVAYDWRDSFLTNMSMLDSVQPNVSGEYEVQYSVSDQAGHTVSATRRVTILAPASVTRSADNQMLGTPVIAGAAGGLLLLIMLVLVLVVARRRRRQVDLKPVVAEDGAGHYDTAMTDFMSRSRANTLSSLPNYSLAELTEAGTLGTLAVSRRSSSTSDAPEGQELYDVVELPKSRSASMQASLNSLVASLTPGAGPLQYDGLESHHRPIVATVDYSHLEHDASSLASEDEEQIFDDGHGTGNYDTVDNGDNDDYGDYDDDDNDNVDDDEDAIYDVIEVSPLYDAVDHLGTGSVSAVSTLYRPIDHDPEPLGHQAVTAVEPAYATVAYDRARDLQLNGKPSSPYEKLSTESFTHEITRAEAERMLKTAQPGSYLARPSSRANTLALSLKKSNGQISHHAIDQVNGVFRFNSKVIKQPSTPLVSLEAAILHVIAHGKDFLQAPDEFGAPVPVLNVSEL